MMDYFKAKGAPLSFAWLISAAAIKLKTEGVPKSLSALPKKLVFTGERNA